MRRLLSLFGLLLVVFVIGFAAYTAAQLWRGARQEAAIAAKAETIFRSPSSAVAGNPGGDVSVVAFFDYNCPYCRHGAPDLAKLIADDGKVRLVLKELPVLGNDSEDVSRVALAAKRHGKYLDFYNLMIAAPGRATKAKALRIAAQLGLDADQIGIEMDDPSITATLLENMRLGRDIGVRGVPYYLVGDRPVGEGEDLYGRLSSEVADIRVKGCHAAC